MTPMDKAWMILKRQTRLYNWIEDYPGKEPVSAWRGILPQESKSILHSGKMSPHSSDDWVYSEVYNNPPEKRFMRDDGTMVVAGNKGTWWSPNTSPLSHEGSSAYAVNQRFGQGEKGKGLVIGHRGPLNLQGNVHQRMVHDPTAGYMRIRGTPLEDEERNSGASIFPEAFVEHEQPIDLGNMVFTQPSGAWKNG